MRKHHSLKLQLEGEKNRISKLSEVIAQLTTVKDEELEKMVARASDLDWQIDQSLSKICDKSEINNIFDNAQAELNGIRLAITCNKSGKPIGKIPVQDVKFLQEMHGNDKAALAMHHRALSSVHPIWLFTDGDALQKAEQYDPVGYMVYCCDRLFPLGDFTEKLPIETRVLRHYQKADLYQIASKLPTPMLRRINELLRRFLGIIKPSRVVGAVKWQWKCCGERATNPADISALQPGLLIQDLQDNIKVCIEYAAKHKRLNLEQPFYAAMELQRLFHGHANILAQGITRYKPMTAIQRAISDILVDVAEDQLKQSHVRKQQFEAKIKETGRVSAVYHQPKINPNGPKMQNNTLWSKKKLTFGKKA